MQLCAKECDLMRPGNAGFWLFVHEGVLVVAVPSRHIPRPLPCSELPSVRAASVVPSGGRHAICEPVRDGPGDRHFSTARRSCIVPTNQGLYCPPQYGCGPPEEDDGWAAPRVPNAVRCGHRSPGTGKSLSIRSEP